MYDFGYMNMRMKRNEVLFDGLEEYMIALLRYGVLDERPTILQPSSQVEWDRMMDIASSQGILAWVWDGICKLPKEFQPPRQQAINWGLSAQEIWDRYNTQKHVLMQIIDVCNQNNIRLLLFKGIALSEFYPHPESRPSSDIDIYLFEDYSRGDRLFAHENVTKTKKRTGFDYNGVHIENHRVFLNAYTKIQKDAIVYLDESLKDVMQTKDGYYIMSPISCVVYQVMHFIAHIIDVSNPASLRFILDIGMTLKNNRDEIDDNELYNILKRLGITKFFSIIIGTEELLMRLDFSRYKYEQVAENEIKAMVHLVQKTNIFFIPVPKRSFRERIRFYISNIRFYNIVLKNVPNMWNRFLKKAIEVIF